MSTEVETKPQNTEDKTNKGQNKNQKENNRSKSGKGDRKDKDRNRSRDRKNGNRRDYKKGGDHENKKRDPNYKSKYQRWEEEMTVTLETPLPELPKEKLKEPSNDDFKDMRLKLVNQINEKKNLIKKLKDERAKAIEVDKTERNKNQSDLKVLYDQSKELKTVVTKHENIQNEIEEQIKKLQDDKDALVKQCYNKKSSSVSQITEKINELDHRQKTEKLTAQQEREILKDLKGLQNTLPLIKDIDVIEKQIKDLRNTKNDNYKILRKNRDQRKEIFNRIDEVK